MVQGETNGRNLKDLCDRTRVTELLHSLGKIAEGEMSLHSLTNGIVGTASH